MNKLNTTTKTKTKKIIIKTIPQRFLSSFLFLRQLLMILDLEMESGDSEQMGSLVGTTDTRGKHRILAELKRLEQEARFLQEELDQLEKLDKASATCRELLVIVETRPDPLLPLTNGPTNPIWDRWFEGPQDPSGCRCWIM